MIPEGIHLAIAAWIDARRGYAGFLSVPGRPLQVRPGPLEALMTGKDPVAAGEFALLANFIPRKGAPSQPFGPAKALWLEHRDTLAGMEFAANAITAKEAEALEQARLLLYPPDGHGRPAPSEKYLSYQEMKAVVDRLELERRKAEEIQQAYADWLVLGYKTEIEGALALLERLARRSSLAEAARERRELQQEFLMYAADMAFAPTYFAPLAAVREETWAQVSVPFAELRAAVPGELSGSGGTFAAGTAEGTCEFGYAVLELIRPWFSAGLYLADDWRLPDGQMVSAGTGVEGRIPGYVQSVYLVTVRGSGGTTPRPTEPARKPPVLAGHGLGQNPRPAHGTVPSRLTTARAATPVIRPLPPVIVAPRLSSLQRDAWTAQLDRIRILLRSRQVAGPIAAPDPVPPPPSECLIVGFGCAKLPSAPHPNEAYTW